MKKFKLIKETKFKKALGKLEGFISRNKRKLQLALPTLGLATIFLTPGTALADEAVTADVENVNEGVTPIEQETTLAAPETALEIGRAHV